MAITHEAVMVGRLDYLDATGHRLIIGGLTFTIAPGVDVAAVREGQIVHVRYEQSGDGRLARAIRRLGPPPPARS